MGWFDKGTGAARDLSPDVQAYLANQKIAASVFDAHPNLSPIREMLKELILWLRPPEARPRPEVDLVITRNHELGAWATPVRGGDHRYVLEVSDTSVRNIRDTFHRALSHAVCFPEIGNPKLEVVTPQILTSLTDNGSDMEQHYVPPIPICKERQAYAALMTNMGLLYLVAHEFGHVAQGHLRLASVLDRSLPPREQQVLEAFADIFAAHAVTRFLVCSAKRDGHCTDHQAVVLAYRVVYLMHMLADFDALWPTDREEFQEHPLARRRQISAVYEVAALYRKVRGADVGAFDEVALMVATERVYRTLTGGEKGDVEHTAHCFETWNHGHLYEIWQVRLRPQLLGLAYTTLPRTGVGPDDVFEEVPE